MLQRALDLLGESRRETKRLQEALKEQMEMTKELQEAVAKQEETMNEMGKQMVEMKEQMAEELKRAREQLETIATSTMEGRQRSYADVTRLTPSLPHNDPRALTAPPILTDTLYCTIDVSRIEDDDARPLAGTIRATVENEVRAVLDNPTWRCKAVTKDPKNPHRIRISCRDKSEHEAVKQIAETKLARGIRVLRDDLYPIKVDNVSRTAVLNEMNEIRIEAIETLGRENDTEVAKISWLSKRDIPKAYGPMVVYLKKRSEARRFIGEGFFVAGGESGTTSVFERRERPKQCTNHKAYQCDRPQTCGNPRQQSGQGHIREIHDATEKLRRDGNRVNLIWLPRDRELKIQKAAKMSARYATEPYMTPRRGMIKAKATILNRTRADLQMERKLPDGVGRHSRKVDSTLP
ncbi:reverse transcriptase, partial [Fusarium bulbicola]